MIDCLETAEDFWLVYELGSKTLGHRLFEIRSESRLLKGDNACVINHGKFYKVLVENS